MPPRVHPVFAGLSTTYLVESEAGIILVDAGCPHYERSILRRIRALENGSLRLIFVTHAHLDHYGSAASLRCLTGAPIAIHRADAGAMAEGKTPIGSVRGSGWLMWTLLRLFEPCVRPEPAPPDLLLKDGDDLRSFGLDAVVVHTPGHTPGSSSLIVEGRVAFVGDLLSTSVRPRVQRSFADDWSLIPHSLARVQELRPEWVYAGHGRRPLSRAALQRLSCRSPSMYHITTEEGR